jgi:nucleotide-binding universal stress UspA family protein
MVEAVAQEANVANFLGEWPGMQSQGVNTKVDCLEGSPAREIIGYAKANNMDLIAMASHGRGGLAWVWAVC